MTLYKRLKEHLPEAKSVISDDEFLILNRKDYHLSQVSGPHALLLALAANCGYPYRVLLSFLDQFAKNCPTDDFNIVIADPGLALAAYSVWIQAGGSEDRGTVYAPKGTPKFPEGHDLVGELTRSYNSKCVLGSKAKPPPERLDYFTFVLGNTKSPEQTLFAVDRYAEVSQGLLVLKDYAKTDAADEREYLEGKRIFPSITFEGHAFDLKLTSKRNGEGYN
jgi:hypothetical protein